MHPDTDKHVSIVQGSPSSQSRKPPADAPPPHAPFTQASLIVQAFPSSQTVPSGLATFLHVPVAGSQEALWHWSMAVQTRGLPPMQVPFWQVSVCVQTLPS